MRALGRTQVLELDTVASMGQLPLVRGRMEGLRQRVRFEQGRRYTDFVPSADRVAACGIGALPAGKVIAQTGLLKGLLALLIAGKKLAPAAVVAAAAAGLRSLFSHRSNDAPPPADPHPPSDERVALDVARSIVSQPLETHTDIVPRSAAPRHHEEPRG